MRELGVTVSQGVKPLIDLMGDNLASSRRQFGLEGVQPGLAGAEPPGLPLAVLDNVAVRFGEDRDVIADTSLVVSPGEFVTLFGPSGSGKSTILNLTAGILRPYRGEVRFGGARLDSVNRSVGYVTQEDTLLPWLTLSGNVGLPLRMRHLPKQVVKSRVSELLGSLGLGDAGSLYPSQLSGGMKKRGLLARALIYQPRMLLMDEPFAALDAQMRARLHDDVLRVVRDTGVAVLFVTHDLQEAAFLSDRVLVIGGTPGHIIDELVVDLDRSRGAEALALDDDFRDIARHLQLMLQTARQAPGDGEIPVDEP